MSTEGGTPRRREPGRYMLGVLIALALPVVAYFAESARDAWRLRGSDVGFESFTGIKLPPGVMVVEHTTRVTDNFFHRSHFWLLDGKREGFRALAAASGLGRSDWDARHMLEPDLFHSATTELMEGYEGSLDGGRDHWLFVIHPGRRALFQY